ncbi:MAG: DEAD/DEAH box helicase [Candidatus Omnitrophota bacterium]
MEKFRALGLSEQTLKALEKKGFEEPTEIQIQTIPLLLKGDIDIIGQAQTGTGKTAAFGLPLIERIEKGSKGVKALILVPTRELALQVSEEINSLKGAHHLQIIAVYGGQSMDQQLRRLHRGVDIVVGTPGRIKDHLQRKSLNLKSISYAVLDEADEMLDMGFIDDVEEILKYTNPQRRTLLFSATMPEAILRLAKKYMGEYKIIRTKEAQLTVSLTDQIYFEVAHANKFEALCRIIDSETNFYGLIFCRTKVDVDNVTKKLGERGYDAEGLHGDFSQNQRERTLNKFKQKRVNVLVATDVAARGIDISDLSHVINYSLPHDPKAYVHRIGRTGRAGKEGVAITFVTPDEYRKLSVIKRITKTDIRKEKLPTVKDVIDSKKARIKKEIEEIIQSCKEDEYMDFAQEILAKDDPCKVLAAFIKYTFAGELSAQSYNEIRDVSINLKGTTRLFVARGKVDSMTPRKLVDMINQTAQVDSRKIRDARIFDNFSFITVPFEEAETILLAFKRDKMNKRPIVERAKEKKRAKPQR